MNLLVTAEFVQEKSRSEEPVHEEIGKQAAAESTSRRSSFTKAQPKNKKEKATKKKEMQPKRMIQGIGEEVECYDFLKSLYVHVLGSCFNRQQTEMSGTPRSVAEIIAKKYDINRGSSPPNRHQAVELLVLCQSHLI